MGTRTRLSSSASDDAKGKPRTPWLLRLGQGQRHEAAHGQFDNLTTARAQIMVDGINLFMAQFSVTNP